MPFSECHSFPLSSGKKAFEATDPLKLLEAAPALGSVTILWIQLLGTVGDGVLVSVDTGFVETVEIVEAVETVDTVGTGLVASNIWTSRSTTNRFPDGRPGTC